MVDLSDPTFREKLAPYQLRYLESPVVEDWKKRQLYDAVMGNLSEDDLRRLNIPGFNAGMEGSPAMNGMGDNGYQAGVSITGPPQSPGGGPAPIPQAPAEQAPPMDYWSDGAYHAPQASGPGQGGADAGGITRPDYGTPAARPAYSFQPRQSQPNPIGQAQVANFNNAAHDNWRQRITQMAAGAQQGADRATQRQGLLDSDTYAMLQGLLA